MNDREAIEMMQRCMSAIAGLREEVSRLRPRAEAYDVLAQVLSYLPQRSVGMSEDLVWVLDKRIREIEKLSANPVESGS